MRQWMVKPKFMCRKHLLGEHVEHHMFVGTIKKDKRIDGYIHCNCLEPMSLKSRHDEIVLEMKRRGYNHKTPISEEDFEICKRKIEEYDEPYINHQIDDLRSTFCLMERCEECKGRFNGTRTRETRDSSTTS